MNILDLVKIQWRIIDIKNSSSKCHLESNRNGTTTKSQVTHFRKSV